MAARTAVVAGTATAVSGRVQRRQANKWAEQDQQQYEQQAPPPQQSRRAGRRAARRGPDREAQGARPAPRAGHPDRRGVRRREGEGPQRLSRTTHEPGRRRGRGHTAPVVATGAVSGPAAGRAGRIPAEAIAGVTLATLAIPEVMGYTQIAGMPVVTGLYTILLPLIAFAILGSSRHLVVGADSATAAILAAGLAGMAATGSPSTSRSRRCSR